MEMKSMPGGFTNKPKILRGAFVEYGLSIPPLIVPFQFNPVQIIRNRNISFSTSQDEQSITNGDSDEEIKTKNRGSLRTFHNRKEYSDLIKLRDDQTVNVNEETLSVDIRLDATDKLNEGDMITEEFGIAPQISTLELMVHPKSESILGSRFNGADKVFSFTKSEKPPMILFIWGRKRVMPVNITNMSVKESEFSSSLNPIRATVSVSMTVIEGANIPYKYTKLMKESMSVLNLTNALNIVDVIIPG